MPSLARAPYAPRRTSRANRGRLVAASAVSAASAVLATVPVLADSWIYRGAPPGDRGGDEASSAASCSGIGRLR